MLNVKCYFPAPSLLGFFCYAAYYNYKYKCVLFIKCVYTYICVYMAPQLQAGSARDTPSFPCPFFFFFFILTNKIQISLSPYLFSLFFPFFLFSFLSPPSILNFLFNLPHAPGAELKFLIH